MNDLRFREVRPEAPLGEEDYERIRREVMTAVKRPESVFVRMRLAAATAVAVSLIAVLLFLVRPQPQTAVAVRPAPAPAPVQKTTPTVVPSPSPQSIATAAPKTSKPGVGRHRSARPRDEATSLVAAGGSEPVVMQLQTSNPDIRIIWIAR